MRHLLLSLLFCCIGVAALTAQRTVSGKVTDSATDEPLIGATVLVKGSRSGTVTDLNGMYSLSVSTNNDLLVVSYTGYKSQEIIVGAARTLDIRLEASAELINEVVVVGYGTALKRELTGNVAKIKSSDIADMPVTSLDQTIQGKAAGVLVNAGSGKLGQSIRVNVRGQSSVSASNQPLFVVDGIPITTDNLALSGGGTNPLADINPQDIESIEILKDASAAAIFGARGANGVVLITTKHGKEGKSKVQFGMQFGSSKPTRKLEFLNTEQYLKLYRQAAANSDRIDGIDPTDPDSYTAYMESYFESQSLGTFGTPQQVSTNWGDLSYQDAPMSQYDLSISGGDKKTQFFVSGQFFDQKGILIGNALNRITGRANLEHQVSSIFKIGLNLNQSRTLNERLSGDRQFDNPVQMIALAPMTPEKDPATGLPVGTPPGDASIPVYYNPLINIGNAYYNTTVNRNISTAYGELGLLKNLRFRTELGLDILNQFEEQYYNSKTVRNFGAPAGLSNRRYTNVNNVNTNNYFNYNQMFGRIHLDATAGMSLQRTQLKRNFVEKQDFPSDAYRQLASAARVTDGSSAQTDFAFLSYFARTNFKIYDRFLFGLSGRIDGSSRFGTNNRYGFFPAVSAGWVLSDESFLKNFKALSFLKLRSSWGRTGNADIIAAGFANSAIIDNFPQLGLFSGDAPYGGNPGQRPSQLTNPDLSWETTDQIDIGIDFGFFNDRLTGEVDVYQKNTTGLLLNVNIPATSGFSTQARNVGKLSNRGLELVLNSNNFVGTFRWTTSFNFAANRNKINDLDGQIIEGGLDNMSRAVEGEIGRAHV